MGTDQELSLGGIEFEMPHELVNGDVKWAARGVLGWRFELGSPSIQKTVSL